MIDINYAWRFALCALTIWRIAHLLARENVPWDLIERLRASLGSSVLGRHMDCFYSMNLLISLLPAIWMSSNWMQFLVQWLALSAVACLLESAMQGGQRSLRVFPISTSYLDKVIDGE